MRDAAGTRRFKLHEPLAAAFYVLCQMPKEDLTARVRYAEHDYYEALEPGPEDLHHGCRMSPAGTRVLPRDGFLRMCSLACEYAGKPDLDRYARSWRMVARSCVMILCRSPFDALYNRAGAIKVHMNLACSCVEHSVSCLHAI